MSGSPFDRNTELSAMKNEIADRAFNLKVKGMLISGVMAAAGLALAFLAPPALLGVGVQSIVSVALLAGSGVVSLITMKEAKKLQIDEEYLQTRMQGKNWWGGYREEVTQQGHEATEGPALSGAPPRKTAQQQR